MAPVALIALTLSLAAAPGDRSTSDDAERSRAQLSAQAQALEDAKARIKDLEDAQAKLEAAQAASQAAAQEAAAEASRQEAQQAAAQASRNQTLQRGADTVEAQARAMVDRSDLDTGAMRRLQDRLGRSAQQAEDHGNTTEAQSTDQARAWMQGAMNSAENKNGLDVPYQLYRATQSLQDASR